MAKTPLVTRLWLDDTAREQGQRLLESVGARGLDVTSAFWYVDPALGDWRLALVTEQYKRPGPLWAYSLVQDVLERENIGLTLSDVAVMPPDDALADAVRTRGFAVGAGGLMTFSQLMGESQETVVYRLR